MIHNLGVSIYRQLSYYNTAIYCDTVKRVTVTDGLLTLFPKSQLSISTK